jgi:tetratricopeptide (TPR) repeat protein
MATGIDTTDHGTCLTTGHKAGLETSSPRHGILEDWWDVLSDQCHTLARRLLANGWTERLRPTQRQEISNQALADANVMLGNGYLQSGQYEKAAEAFTNAIGRDPRFAKAFFLLGMTRSCQKDHAAAIGHYSQAVALRPDKAGYYFCRGQAREALRQPNQALDDYAIVLQLEPEHHGARARYRELSELCRRTGNGVV